MRGALDRLALDKYEAELVVEGRQRAHDLAARFEASQVSLADYVQRVAPGWYRLRPTLGPDELAALLRDLGSRDPGATAIGALGGIAPMTFVATLADGQVGQTMLGDPDMVAIVADVGATIGKHVADPTRLLAEWSARAPKTLTQNAAGRLVDKLAGVKGATAPAMLMRRLGFKLSDWDPNAGLGGYSRDPGITVNPVVGLTQIDLNTARYVPGRGDGFAGIWDRDNPDQPIETWPDTEQGRAAMKRRQFELVEAPIFARTLCLGERRWAPVCEGEIRSYTALPPAALLWIHEGNGGMVYCYGRPFTYHVYRDGMLGREDVRTVEDAMTVSSETIKTRQAGPWQPVPDDVPRPLLETNEWVRRVAAQALAKEQ